MSHGNNIPQTIGHFWWDTFPVEQESFSVCLIISEHPTPEETKDLEALKQFLISVFPENKSTVNTINDIQSYKADINGNKKNKKTLIWEGYKDEYGYNINEPTWPATQHLLSTVRDKGHFLGIDTFQHFPKTLLSITDLIIFQNVAVLEEYFKLRKPSFKISLDSDDCYVVADKRRFEFKLALLNKASLQRYFKT